MSEALDLCRALIQCPSVTPADAGALGLIERVLSEAGFETHLVSFSQEGYPDTPNLYARIGAGSPCLLFAGHTDVVPVGDASAWRFDPFSAEVAEGMVWGRGATDMKGGVAASLAATLAHLRAPAPDHALGDFRREGIKAPCAGVADRHHIRMARKEQAGRTRSDPRIEIGRVGIALLREAHEMGLKARLRQNALDQPQRASIRGRHRGALDEGAAEVEGFAHSGSLSRPRSTTFQRIEVRSAASVNVMVQ